MKRTVFVPLVFLYPCASLPNSLHIATVQTGTVTGSSANVLYFVIVSLVIEWTTTLQVGRKHVSALLKISVSCEMELALSWEINAGKEFVCFDAWMRADCCRGGNFVGAGFMSSWDINGNAFSFSG